MGYYRSNIVPPKGSVNEPELNMFERQAPTDLFTEWKYNAVIDNLELFLKTFLPFYISGCDITYQSEDSSEGYIRYSLSKGLVFCDTLIYVQQQEFETPYTNNIYVVLIKKDGTVITVPIDDFDFNTHVVSLRMCKIGYVCRTVRKETADKEMYLINLPLETARYNTLSYYGGYGVYG